MTDWLTTLKEQIEADVTEAQIPGMAMMVSRNGEVCLEHFSGYRDVKNQLPVTSDTIFGLASLTKSVVAVAVMMLQDAGKLQVSDHVVKWLPELKKWNTFYKQRITIHHLLTHTAGLSGMGAFHLARRESIEADADGEYLFGSFTGDHYVYTVRDLIEAMIKEDAPFVALPGEMFNYSNEGYALLQEIVERASGEEFASFVQTSIFQPLGMTRAIFSFDKTENVGDVTELYAFTKEPPKEVFHSPAWWGSGAIYGAGALKASAKDVQKYVELFRNDGEVEGVSLVSRESMKEMKRAHITTPNGVSYGYGLIVGTHRGHQVIGHGGGVKGISSFMLVCEQEITITVLTNIAEVSAENFAMTTLDVLLKDNIYDSDYNIDKVDTHTMTLPPDMLAMYTGIYETNERQSVHVTAKENGLQLQIQQQSPVHVLPCGDHQFVLPDGKKVTFLLDEEGAVRGIFRGMRFIQKRSDANGLDNE